MASELLGGDSGGLAGGRDLQVMSSKPTALEDEKSGMRQHDVGSNPSEDGRHHRLEQAEKFEEWSENFSEASSLPLSQTLRTSLAPKQEDALMNAARTLRIPSSSSEGRTPEVPQSFFIGEAPTGAAPEAANAEAMRRPAVASLSNEERTMSAKGSATAAETAAAAESADKVDRHDKHASQEYVLKDTSTSKDEVEELSEALEKHREAQKMLEDKLKDAKNRAAEAVAEDSRRKAESRDAERSASSKSSRTSRKDQHRDEGVPAEAFLQMFNRLQSLEL